MLLTNSQRDWVPHPIPLVVSVDENTLVVLRVNDLLQAYSSLHISTTYTPKLKILHSPFSLAIVSFTVKLSMILIPKILQDLNILSACMGRKVANEINLSML